MTDNKIILTYYTDRNGNKWNRDEIADKILNKLDCQGMSSAQLANSLKMKSSVIYSVLSYMIHHRMVIKEKTPGKSRFIFRRVQECLLAKLKYPSPEQIEKKFKIIDRKKVTIDNGTAKSFNRKGISPYSDHYLNSVYWNYAD